MVITYHGQNNFRITSGQTALAIDPLNDRLKPTLSIKTLIDPVKVSEESNVISIAGEFDLNNIEVKGFQLDSESTAKFVKNVFLVKGIEDLRLAFLGHTSNDLDKEIIESLGVVDILFMSIGGHYLKTESAEKIIKSISPKMIIIASSEKDINEKSLSKEFGKDVAKENKITIKAKDLPDKGFDIFLLDQS